MIKVQTPSHRNIQSKLERLKVGDEIILELVFDENQFSMYSELTVIALDKPNQTGQARFNQVRERSKVKTFNDYSRYAGSIISFNYNDIGDVDN
ncbi:hypothetical protein EUX52_06070 [Haemophilus haemolyticus]|uniref:Uncharacterized protein n=1 Tax=Haemophilus haemolyticus TaxID=726 RepID=A0A502LAF5_HAEHA|nr:hypothetical protein [Haemophilus haemolyticus]TPH21042.1 hypothetical protein EUX52_06070 [Haemophilus haemolyticus]